MRAPPELRRRPAGRGMRLLIAGIGFVLALAFVIAGVRHLSGERAQRRADAPAGPTTRAVTLHFRDDRGRIVSEAREVAEKPDLARQVRAVLEEELAGSMAGHASAIPAGTVLHHVFTSPGGTVTVDLSRDVVRGQPGDLESEYTTLAALVRTIRLNFPEITTVQVLIEGKPEVTLAGHFALDAPLVGDEWTTDAPEERAR